MKGNTRHRKSKRHKWKRELAFYFLFLLLLMGMRFGTAVRAEGALDEPSISMLDTDVMAMPFKSMGTWEYHDDDFFHDPIHADGIYTLPNIQAVNEASGWTTFNFPSRPPMPLSATRVWISSTLSKDTTSEDALCFKSIDQSFRVWVGNRLIYQYGSLVPDHFIYGFRWFVIPLPPNSAGQRITFELQSANPWTLGTFKDFYVRARLSCYFDVFLYDAPFIFNLSIVLILALIVCVYLYSRKKQRMLYAMALCFLIVYGTWMISTANVTIFFLDWPWFWWILQLTSVYLMPLFSSLAFGELTLRQWRRPIHRWAMSFGVLLIFAALSDIFIQHGLYLRLMILGVYPLTTISNAYILYALLRSYRLGYTLARAALLPIIIMATVMIVNGVDMYYHILPWGIYLAPFGSFAMVFFLLGLIREQIHDEVANIARERILQEKISEAKREAHVDPLTGAFNRYKFSEAFRYCLSVVTTTACPLSCLMIDIDFFKSINDTYGHDEGDRVLVGLVSKLLSFIDRRHTLIRWGGEEFVILCLHHDLQMAKSLAERIRQGVALARLSQHRVVHCSIGVSCWHDKGDDEKALIKRADEALYLAKETGRNCVATENDYARAQKHKQNPSPSSSGKDSDSILRY